MASSKQVASPEFRRPLRQKPSAADAQPALRPPQQQRSEETQARMIAAGQALIEEHGSFEQVVLSEVIRRARTSTGAFYGRFQNRQAFLDAVMDVTFTRLHSEADARLQDERLIWEHGRPDEVAARIVRHFVLMCRTNLGMFKACLRHFAAGDPDANPMRALNRHQLNLFVPMLAARIHQREPDATGLEDDIRVAMQMMVGTLVFTMLTDPGPLHLKDDAIEARLLDLMKRFLALA